MRKTLLPTMVTHYARMCPTSISARRIFYRSPEGANVFIREFEWVESFSPASLSRNIRRGIRVDAKLREPPH